MPIATPQGTLDFKSVDTVTFVGASSNTVIDTTTGSLGVGVDGNGPTSNLHVVGNTRLEGDINMLHTSNTASIKLNSNVVTEFPRSKKLIKYPRVAMGSLTQDDYTVTASSTYIGFGERWKVFDNSLTDGDSWASLGSTYSTDGQTHTGSGTLGGFSGEWIQLQLPEKIKLEYVRIFPRNYQATQPMPQSPKDYVIIGSTDGTTYKLLATVTNQADNGSWMTTNINTTELYMYFAVVVSKVHSTSLVAFSELEFWGTPEYDPEADGVDVVVKSVPNVPNTDWLEVYYEGKNYTNGNSVQDETDNNIDGSFTGITYNTEYNSFDFSGVTDSSKITATLPSTFAGNQPFTVSVWFKRYNDLVTENTIWRIGPRTDEKCLGLAVSGGNFNFFGNDSTDGSFSSTTFNGGGYVVGRWYHVACVYDGSSRYIFIDSVRDGTTVTNSLDFNASTELVLGFNGVDKYLNGSIANFRLFNRALTSDEIYQLYAYQKEYFGHGDLGMTLKAGRLGIGTSEPRAALDVRGDLYAPGTIVQVEQAVKTNTSAVTSTSAVDIGYLSVDITPKFSTSKILVSYIVNVGVDITGTTNMHGFLRVKRTQGGISTYIGDGASSGDRQACTSYIYNTANAMCESFSFEHLDDANGTGTVTYTIQGLVEASVYTMTINRSGSDGNNGYYGRTSSSITVKEVCQ
jgi:hypothetical protein